MKPLILASKSPRRKNLLKQIGIRFRLFQVESAEVITPHQSPGENAQRIALEKATDVASRMRRGIVIGADTIVVLDHHVLGKPKSKDDAKQNVEIIKRARAFGFYWLCIERC